MISPFQTKEELKKFQKYISDDIKQKCDIAETLRTLNDNLVNFFERYDYYGDKRIPLRKPRERKNRNKE